ncbi:hypothetical protein Pint_03768 [Pistacia integerrima]|uniref:Uncharacterized protein n=1 Tax=Pistacia integerrima TaxID=434235 RepID=A0ACC0Z3S4_9ROSI|nr:hypothetical protein Pint_03768 [Pistacia integerrima]
MKMSSHKQEDIDEEKCYRSSGMWQIDSFMKAMCEVDASKFLH